MAQTTFTKVTLEDGSVVWEGSPPFDTTLTVRYTDADLAALGYIIKKGKLFPTASPIPADKPSPKPVVELTLKGVPITFDEEDEDE